MFSTGSTTEWCGGKSSLLPPVYMEMKGGNVGNSCDPCYLRTGPN